MYYAQSGLTVLLLLCGGDKRSQQVDISRACRYWQDWQSRSAEQE
jgi:putative addiction module killer protein